MLELNRGEIMRISQSVISSPDLKFSKRVYTFTEQGVAMLPGGLAGINEELHGLTSSCQ
ncbi:MAG: hypothetical protein HYV35_12330 [Lentisphaerae bacterium]|nr:hypothetical protein [Lentisphaerota bacterium]